jgi:2-aminoadipate transaminase
MHSRLSSYGEASTTPAPVNRMMSDFAHDFRDGVDINLGVGYVNERTIPVAFLEEAMHAVAADPARYRQAFNYGGPAGSPNLVASLRRFLVEHKIGGLDHATVDRNRLIIGTCGATSLLSGLADVFEPGIVITSDPMYYIYTETLERRGFELLSVPEDSEGIELDALDRKLAALGDHARHIAFFYAVTVNNPSCTMLSNARRRALYERALRLGVPIIYDLAYELLLHDPAAVPFESMLPYDDAGIAYEIGTLSKVFAPALRIGYLLGPRSPMMHAMVQRTSDTGFSAPLFVQEMASYVLDHHIGEQLRTVNAGYREKALIVKEAIERELGEFLEEVRGGSAGFYFYLTFKEIETHTESPFFALLTHSKKDARVYYIPGNYCVNPRGDLARKGARQLRLSYGFEDAGRIVDALKRMRAAAIEVRTQNGRRG